MCRHLSVVTPGRLCWPFNWFFVMFLSTVVFMSTRIIVVIYSIYNYYVDCGPDLPSLPVSG